MKTISVENVSKRFVLAHNRPKNLADAARAMLRRSKREDFWALKDVSFEVEQGEALGIIGHNGAGKSTMLKLLTRIMQPTEGRIRTRGRVSALIEIGAGFHPEMTGRENIYLNGSILGMTRREIDHKFDDIVAFAELGQFIDMPVKRYSSGMYARLGFAVAAHVDPDVLIVDEVLSVGDAKFQEKCSARMQELRRATRTVVFVSHNMGAVVGLCNRVLLMENGSVRLIADPQTAVRAYRTSIATHTRAMASSSVARADLSPASAAPLTITDIKMIGNSEKWTVRTGDPVCLQLHYLADSEIPSPRIGLHILDDSGRVLVHLSNAAQCIPPNLVGHGICEVSVDSLPLAPGTYLVVAKTADRYGTVVYDNGSTSRELTVLPPLHVPETGLTRSGVLWIDSQWKYHFGDSGQAADRLAMP